MPYSGFYNFGRHVRSNASITASTTAYSAGDVVGTVIEFENVVAQDGGSGEICTALLFDLANQGITANLVLFDESPASSDYVDNAAIDVVDSDLPNVIGVINFSSDNYTAFADDGVFTETPNLGFRLDTHSRSLFGVLTTAGTPTYEASDLSIKLIIDQD